MSDIRQQIEQAIKQFTTGTARDCTRKLLNVLGYQSDKTVEIAPNTWQGFNDNFISSGSPFSTDSAMVSEWKNIDIIFQLTDEELSKTRSLFQTNQIQQGLMASYLFFSIHLKGQRYPRNKLAQITRQLNRVFPMPVMVFFVYNGLLSIAVINRRRNKRDADKDVLGKVTLIQEISLASPHRGHLEILSSLSAFELSRKRPIKSFDDLHAAWSDAFDIELLNKRFYQRVAEWFFFAVDQVEFPHGGIDKADTRNRIALIRMLTRIIFCWFAKEKGLIPAGLFEFATPAKVLKTFDPLSMEDGSYYKAILQNLFFPTLSVPLAEREFRNGKRYKGINKHYMQHNYFRYEELFRDSEDLGRLFANIPFLNGGLFECLDFAEKKGGKNIEVRVDGFSDNPSKQPNVPNALFFGKEMQADLSEAFYSPKKASVKVDGLFHILDSYKFTVTENTPIEEEIALDPELLGRIFENLLAQYNPETEKTARKETGSFYTPRTIVDYMVNESLKAYLKQRLAAKMPSISAEDAQAGLDILFSYTEKEHAFSAQEQEVLVDAIYDITILDPACGSGAFPIGMLQKLVYVLEKLDHDHERWKERILRDTPPAMREDTRKLLERSTAEYNWKLGLIQHCIYGIDIQPIAVQIAKLRCFIALLVDFDVHPDEENFGVPALPNLEFKFVAADTLINPPGAQKKGELFGLEDPFFEDFAKAAEEYFFVRDPNEKEQLKNRIEVLIEKKIESNERFLSRQRGDEHASSAIRDAFKSKNKAAISRVERDIELWESYRNLFAKRNDHVKFFEIRYFFPEINEGFDVIIGNPPYIQIQKFPPEKKDEWISQGYHTYAATGDVYSLFYEKGSQLLKPKGHLCYISSNKWMRAGYGELTRSFLAESVCLEKLIDFGGVLIFSSATVDTSVVQFRKEMCDMPAIACYVGNDFNYNDNLETYFQKNKVIFCGNKESSWVVRTDKTADIRKVIENQGIELRDWQLTISYGVKTGDNDIFYLPNDRRDEIVAAEPQSANILLPLIRGRFIERYGHNWDGTWMIGTFPSLNLEIDDYPVLKQYLLANREKIEPKPKNYEGKKWHGRKSGSYKWFETQDSISYRNDFLAPKIIYPNMTKYLPFYYDKSDHFFINDKAFIMYSNEVSLQYLCAIFNSSLFRCAFKDNFPTQGEDRRELRKIFFDKIPIKKPSGDLPGIFAALVCAVQLAKRWKSDINPAPLLVSNFLEEVIDACVMEVYFAEHMRERKLDIISHVQPLLPPTLENLVETEQWRKVASFFEQANAPSHPIRNRLMRLTADSPELLAIIKEEGKV